MATLKRASVKRGASGLSYFVGQQGWLDLLSSLFIPQVKVFRVFRVVRVVRLLRLVGPRRFLNAVLSDRASSALLTVVFLAILLLEFGAGLMLAIELQAPDGKHQRCLRRHLVQRRHGHYRRIRRP